MNAESRKRADDDAGQDGSTMRRRIVRTLLVVGGGVAVVALLAFGLTRDAYVLPSPLVDGTAPSFALPVMPERPDDRLGDREGRDTVRLEEHRGHVVVVNFWASWCLACRQEHAALSRAATRTRDRGVRFFGVLYQDDPPNARRFIRETGGQSYPTLLDPGSRMAIDYGVYGVPETYFIGPDGAVSHKHVGPVNDSILSTRVAELIPGERDAVR